MCALRQSLKPGCLHGIVVILLDLFPLCTFSNPTWSATILLNSNLLCVVIARPEALASSSYMLIFSTLEPLDTFEKLETEKQKKVHRFTNNLQGLQNVMVKDFS